MLICENEWLHVSPTDNANVSDCSLINWKLKRFCERLDISLSRHKWKEICNALTFCMLGNFACFCRIWINVSQINFYKQIFQEYNQSVKQFGSRSGRCQACSGFKLFAKVISRRQKSPLAGKELHVKLGKRIMTDGLKVKSLSKHLNILQMV